MSPDTAHGPLLFDVTPRTGARPALDRRPRWLAAALGLWAAGLLAPAAGAAAAEANGQAALPELPRDPQLLRREQLCGPPLAPAPQPGQRARRDDPDTPLVLLAERISSNALQALYELRGDAELRRLDQRLRADALRLDEQAGVATVPGRFRYTEAGLHLWGEAGRFDLEGDRMAVEAAEFRLYPYRHGRAQRLTGEGERVTRLEGLRYSTCPPGREAWWLRASELELDHEAGVGRARHARLEIAGVPWLYSPYLQFPIDDRAHSGLLPPSFGESDRHGSHFTVPLYLRLAPNYDLTLAPTYYSRRGLQANTELRYLERPFSGELAVEYLPDDTAYAEQRPGEADTDRWGVNWQHRGDLPAAIDYRIDLERVSDPTYLDDFSSDRLGSSTRELESRALVEQSIGSHAWQAELQHWQNLRPESQADAYRRWPALTYQHDPAELPGGLAYRLEGEAVRFALPGGPEVDRPTGRRYHLNPRLSWPVREQAFFLEPAVSLHHTRYDLERAGAPAGAAETSRTVPIASVDAGIFLERPFSLGSRPFLQTLEPRLFYLYAPYREQSGLPIFDTTERGNTVSQLFQENRFSGIDRIGDANQITTAVTTRVLDIADGAQPLRASLGQVHYLEDRRVTLGSDPDAERLTEARSDLFADAELRLPGNLRLRAEYRYDPDRGTRSASRYTADWQYRPGPASLVNLAYRVREETASPDGEPVIQRTQELIEASAAAPLGTHWRAVGHWAYSRLERQHLEVVAGVEHRRCCWAVRGTVRRFRSDFDEPLENAFMIELELSGLGRFGQGTTEFFRDVVPSYGETVF